MTYLLVISKQAYDFEALKYFQSWYNIGLCFLPPAVGNMRYLCKPEEVTVKMFSPGQKIGQAVM